MHRTVVGDKVGKWLKTPFDLLAFGARASAGALVSAPAKLSTLQSDIERVIELAQDPRPLEEKQAVIALELESTLLEYLEKGADVEVDVIANIKTVLPPEAANLLTEIIPSPPNKTTNTADYSSYSSSDVTPAVTYAKEDVAANQIVSEITEIKQAVSGLKAALDAIRSNEDATQVAIMRLNLKEARDNLSRRLAEVLPTDANDASIAAVTKEAGILLQEVNAQFFA